MSAPDRRIVEHIREHIASTMYLARRVGAQYRRNLAADARAWNKYLVRELRGER